MKNIFMDGMKDEKKTLFNDFIEFYVFVIFDGFCCLL